MYNVGPEAQGFEMLKIEGNGYRDSVLHFGGPGNCASRNFMASSRRRRSVSKIENFAKSIPLKIPHSSALTLRQCQASNVVVIFINNKSSLMNHLLDYLSGPLNPIFRVGVF